MRLCTTSLYWLLILFPWAAMAQALTGKVIDPGGMPLMDAHVYKADLSTHSHTNDHGRFKLLGVKPGDTVVISFLGFSNLNHRVGEEDLSGVRLFNMVEKNFELSQVEISNSVNSTSRIAAIDLNVRPVTSSQAVLQSVPGLLIAQHAGGGKAEQIFLRGFDIDHGTDINITVDGMPVNMVSHAHGQGYADLHFLIPETVKHIDFAKGPYYSDQGNFNTAGYVNFKTRDYLDNNYLGLEYGQFGTLRTVGMFDLVNNPQRNHAYVAAEYLTTDGPTESPQDLQRVNVMGKYSHRLNRSDQLTVTMSHFNSRWDASGQIPVRLVEDGTISRFGSVDDTEGGTTRRTHFNLEYTKSIGEDIFIKSQFYHIDYGFELYSNFTFFLEDPINGDQIRQREDRRITGWSATLFDQWSLAGHPLQFELGTGLRHDDVNDNELSRTANKTDVLERLSLGQVAETNYFFFTDVELDLGKWLVNAGLRYDIFRNAYTNNLLPASGAQSSGDAVLLPKMNVIFNPSHNWQVYLKTGMGFHSNDTRVVVPRNGQNTLPVGSGVDLGFIWKPVDALWLNAAVWSLGLDQEFVYVGDAGIVEPSGRSMRRGFELGFRYQIADWLFADADFVYTHARSRDDEAGRNYIPLAVDAMSSGGLSVKHARWTGGLRYRFLNDRPANEDNSIQAIGYVVTDANISYNIGDLSLGLIVENLFDTEWNEAQFATESRLQNEAASVEEIHFTPGVPFFVRMKVGYGF